jgi:SAM-dependent methyltransferase
VVRKVSAKNSPPVDHCRRVKAPKGATVRWSSRRAEVVPSPNIWYYQADYELENRAQDSGGEIWRVLREEGDWAGRDVLDVGCGDGFHLPRFARDARSVLGVEPHEPLVRSALERVKGLSNVDVKMGRAQRLPVRSASVDVVHARTAYFFGPGCEPGLAELDRVVRRGGVALVVDNDPTRSTFGRWFRRGYPDLPDPATVERFWSARGWTRTPVDMAWRFSSRADLEAVVRIEFDRPTAEAILAEHAGTEVDYAVNLWWKRF